MAHVVEWAPFTVIEGADEQKVVAASEALQRDFLAKQPGFVKRDLLRIDERRWVDLVVWESRAAVDHAMRAAATSQACHAYFSLMVMNEHADPAAGVTILDPIRSYSA